jgi:hypothetical protein
MFDKKIVGNRITIDNPIFGYVAAQEIQHCGAEILKTGVAFVARGVPVQQPHNRSIGVRGGQYGGMT